MLKSTSQELFPSWTEQKREKVSLTLNAYRSKKPAPRDHRTSRMCTDATQTAVLVKKRQHKTHPPNPPRIQTFALIIQAKELFLPAEAAEL